jgi:choline dehydrogenase-like flavoprotein
MYLSSRTGPWTSKASTALGFPSLAQVLGTNVDNMTTSQFAAAVSMMIERAEQGGRYYPSMYELDKTLRAGYELQFSLLLQNLLSNDTPAYEILNDNSGGLDLALMHPLSRGTTHITTTDPLADPAVDPRWLVNPFDFDVMLTSMQFNQRILDTPSIQQALQPSYAQISQNCTRDQLSDLLRTGVNTEYHYSGTAAMMPRELGGVVDPNLVVYGTSNLRVVDTSIFPVIPGGHLQAVAYAVAEKGADIIRGIGVNITRDSFDREAP